MISSSLSRLLKGPKEGGVFYLFGDEEYQKEAAAKAIQEHYLELGTADFNLDRLRGNEVELETLASVLGTPPMMAEWRVVVVREVEGFAGKASTRGVLMDIVNRPPPGLVLILLASVPKGSRARFYSDLRKAARSLEFKGLSPDDAPGWLMQFTRDRFGRELEPDAAVAVVAALGTDLGPLAAEVEKLAAVAEDGAPITLEVVRAAGTHIPSADRWRWFDTVAACDFTRAMDDLPVLLGQGESGVGLTIGLSAQFLRMGVAIEAGTSALEVALPPHQRWLAGKITQLARGWTPERLAFALLELEAVDQQLKRSALGDEHLLGTWLLARMVEQAGLMETA